MIFANVKSATIPEGDIKRILQGSIVLWEAPASYVNLLPLATDLDRVTIYNGIGYKPDTRLSSSTSTPGSTSSKTGMFTSGFIPAKVGDILRIKGTAGEIGTASYVISFTSANARVKAYSILQNASTGEWSDASKNQTYENGILTIPLVSSVFGTGFDAIRFSAGTIDENTIVTINQEIPT